MAAIDTLGAVMGLGTPIYNYNTTDSSNVMQWTSTNTGGSVHALGLGGGWYEAQIAVQEGLANQRQQLQQAQFDRETYQRGFAMAKIYPEPPKPAKPVNPSNLGWLDAQVAAVRSRAWA